MASRQTDKEVSKVAARKEAKRERDNFRRRKNAAIKKNYQLHKDFGAVVYSWFYMNGQSFIYRSSDDPKCPPSLKKIMTQKYPAPIIETNETLSSRYEIDSGTDSPRPNGKENPNDSDGDGGSSSGSSSDESSSSSDTSDGENPRPQRAIDGPVTPPCTKSVSSLLSPFPSPNYDTRSFLPHLSQHTIPAPRTEPSRAVAPTRERGRPAANGDTAAYGNGCVKKRARKSGHRRRR